jgi:hypothetical protein
MEAYFFIWFNAGGSSMLLAIAYWASIFGFQEMDRSFSLMSGLFAAISLIPFYYLSGYFLFNKPRSANIAAVVAAILFSAGILLVFNSRIVSHQLATNYFAYSVQNKLVLIFIAVMGILPVAMVSLYLFRTALHLEGTGRRSSVWGTLALDLYVLGLLVNVLLHSIPSNLFSRLLCLASASLIFITYYFLPEE